MAKSIQTAYRLSMPDVIGENPQAFKFQAKTGHGTFGFGYRWDTIREIWLLYVTLPSGVIRQAGIFPNDISWTPWDDFGFYVESNADSIGQNDLNKINQYILVWA